MKLDWATGENHLLLNPRLPVAVKERFETAWLRFVPPKSGQIGIVTSGSSGDSIGRLILISKTALLANAESVNSRLQSTSDDIWMKTLPDFHVGGLGIYARAYLSGARVCESRLERWDPLLFHRELVQADASLLSLVPTQLFDLVSAGLQSPARLRAAVIGGGRLESSLLERALQLGWPALPSYGCTECGSQVATALSPQDPRLMPLSHADVRIGSDERFEIRSRALLNGQIVFDDTSGELVDPKRDGWFFTEDRGCIKPDGSLEIFGRTADFVKVGGEGVLVSRLEDRLEKIRVDHRIAGDVAILAAHDERLGAMIILLSTGDNATTDIVVSEFNAAVSPFERVRSVFQVSEIPRSALGKLLRAQALAAVGLQPPTHS